ncbi:hypothetical protein V8G54_018987 [Vigna mungo]|uniref:Uncharacterized protein n=1 Tax=Vigna mungo TaxID=3915 RepID=A0AAQ3RV92_VIGMU
MGDAIDLTGDGGVIKTILRKSKADAVGPTENFPLVDGSKVYERKNWKPIASTHVGSVANKTSYVASRRNVGIFHFGGEKRGYRFLVFVCRRRKGILWLGWELGRGLSLSSCFGTQE